MNVFLWILQALLAAAFLAAGAMKLSQSKDKLRPQMGWVDQFSDGSVKLIGAADALGGLGLVLPWALGIAKILTPLAAVGLAILMVGAVVVHTRRKEPAYVQVVLGILAIVIAIGRF